jgi:hypothetical protein
MANITDKQRFDFSIKYNLSNEVSIDTLFNVQFNDPFEFICYFNYFLDLEFFDEYYNLVDFEMFVIAIDRYQSKLVDENNYLLLNKLSTMVDHFINKLSDDELFKFCFCHSFNNANVNNSFDRLYNLLLDKGLVIKTYNKDLINSKYQFVAIDGDLDDSDLYFIDAPKLRMKIECKRNTIIFNVKKINYYVGVYNELRGEYDAWE